MSGDRQRCVCGHPRETHEHYRRGSDCSLCGVELCPRFRRTSVLATLLRRRPDQSGPAQSVVAEFEHDRTNDPDWRADRARDDAAS